MSKKKKSKHTKFISHPRYGDKPRFTNDKYSMEEVVGSHWSYNEDEVVLNTCIEANIDKQKHSISPRKLYVDLIHNCRGCGGKFIFYAIEQQHWYEQLGFDIGADCVKCVNCRKKDQELKLLIKRYNMLMEIGSDRNTNEDKEFKSIAYELYQIGYIKNENKLPKS